MSTPPPPQPRRSAGEGKKTTPPTSSIVTRNGARKAKIQTRAMSAGAKPSASVLAAKKKALQKKKQTVDTVIRDHYQIAMESKNKVKGPTGFVTEPRMAEHRCLWDENYPECPERLIRVIDRCKELNLIEQCKEFPPRAADKEELNVLHSPSVFEMLETTHQNNNLEYLEDLSSKYDAIYIHPSTHSLALMAAGSTIDMVDRIVSGAVQNGAALVRPPGHHAMAAEPCGYCFYNNVALAARHAIDKRGLNRILIVDWDVHHGQATQQMFYDDPRVVYFSIHRYEHGAFWPNLRQSDFHYVGSGRGAGTTFNVPLNKTGMHDGDYLAIWHQLLLPMAFEYQPELILVSAGYDAAIGCPEFSPELVIVSAGYDAALGDEKGEMEVSPACYATLTHLLMSVCPAVCVVLEGGYCVPSLAEGAALTLRTLLGHPPPALAPEPPSDDIRESILNCIYAHKPYWRCYNYQPTYSIDESVPNVCDRAKQKHTVSVRWEGDETRPDRFATRDCYPLQDNETKKRNMEKLNRLRLVTDLTLPQHAVGYIYDQAMLKHKNICEPGHVECPERIMRIHERHRDFGLLERLHHIQARAATDEEILAVHTRNHLNRLKELSSTKLRDLNSQKEAFDSVYFHPESLESASVAMGCVLQMVDAVLGGTCGAGTCVVRPPGHHADADLPSGFCLLNAAAAAAAYAVQAHGLTRVMILDWDVHHGNGTQRITYRDDKVSGGFTTGNEAPNGFCLLNAAAAAAAYAVQAHGLTRVMILDWDVHHGNGTQRITYRDDKVSGGFTTGNEAPNGFCLLNAAAAAAAYAVQAHGLTRVMILDWDVHHGNGTQRITYRDDKVSGGFTTGNEAPNGFCLLNAAAAAAAYAVQAHGLTRVMILDWDVHHGNGTQRITYRDDKVSGSTTKSGYESPSGFCLLNAAAAAAAYAVQAHGLTRVMILDWDVHHGNGTQRITYRDDKILYVSIHRYDNGSFFPHSTDADYTAVGEGRGEGFNINIPWNKRGMGDAEYLAALSAVVLPVAAEFRPQLLLVSAGFDACVGDPLGGCKVSPECYGRMTHLLRSVAGGRVILCLEGGYNVTSIAYAMTLCTKALLGDPIHHHHDPKPTVHWSAVESINNVINTHKKYWKNLKFQLALPIENVLPEPHPSRGLTITDHNESHEKLAELSLASSLDESKSKSQLDGSLEINMANLSIDRPKCEDGIHCGTDDEDNGPDGSKNKTDAGDKETAQCSKKQKKSHVEEKEVEGSSSRKENEGSSKKDEQKTTLVDYLAENMQAIVDGEMFAVIPLPWCPHLETMYAIPGDVKFKQGVKCVDCDETAENWVCLHCFVIACGRSVNAHMQAHYRSCSHPLVLSLLDLSVWCNECDAYVDHELLYDAKNNAHRCKFGEDMPWCYKSDTLHLS